MIVLAPIEANYHVVRKAGTWLKKMPFVSLKIIRDKCKNKKATFKRK